MMARLICSAITSLDGYVADEQGKFERLAPDDEVHAFVNELERPVGTYLYGRRLYEVMVYWETVQAESAVDADYAKVWKAARKIVYSTTLDKVSSARTSIERTFDPAAVRSMKEAAERDLSIGGPALAAHGLRAGLVDEIQLFVCPLTFGGGTPFYPAGVRLDLELVDERRFASGVTYLRYQVSS